MSLIEQIEDYWTKRSYGFSSAIREEINDRGKETVEELVAATGITRGSKVLDLGCGPGFYSILLAKFGADITGIDYSEGMIAKAKQNAEEFGVSVDFLKMDAQHLEFENESFDTVVTRNMLWSLERPADCYKEILRVLKPGCKALVLDGNFYLRLYNPDYDCRPTIGDTSKDYHGRHNTDNVDFKIIENLARDLPLSKQERPQWDVSVLSKLGCRSVNLEFPASNGRFDCSKVVPSFKITITKE